MISRQWRGLAKPVRADEYGVELLIMTRWDSIDAVQWFAGRDASVAVVPEKVQEMMLAYDRTVRHYEIVQ